jgi:hypothetical protein
MVNFDRSLCHKLANELSHFIDLACSREPDWKSVHWFELLEAHAEVGACF